MKITIKSLSKIVLAAVLSVSAFTFTANAQHSEAHVDTTVHTEAVATTVEHTETHAAEAHGEAHGVKEKFSAGKLITEHIIDAYGWHLWGHTSIPLPVILYSSANGLEVFSSNAFGHAPHYEKVPGKNGVTYTIVHNKVVAIDASGAPDEAFNKGVYDFSITKNVASMWFSILLLLIIFFSVASSYKKNKGKAPSGMQSLIEPIILFLRDDVAKPAIGHKHEKFMPFLLTVFFFILINNLMGLVPIAPGGANLTGNITVTAVLACFTFIYVTLSGNANYWAHIFFMPGVPKPVLLILTPIEILGVFLRPFVLMIRLFANITAGHIIALSFFSLIFIFGEMSQGAGYGVGIFSVAFTIFMSGLEVLVAFIQAYVFTLLSAMYLGAAVEEAHH